MIKSLEKPGEIETCAESKPGSENKKESLESKEHISVDVFRHSGPPFYQLNEWLVRSNSPEAAPDAFEQWFNSDLPPEGLELARTKAEEYFDKLNPETDTLFFVSSDLVRAAETARIFLDVARERGFEIIKPRSNEGDQKYKNHAEEHGEGWIRKIDCLTLDHLENMLREFVFAQKDYLKEGIVNPDAVSKETRGMWMRARKIMEEGGIEDTWGKNYAKFAEKLEKAGIFLDVLSAEQVYKSKFFNMARLVKFAEKKMREQKPKKNVRVLGFSHENSFLHFLNENFGEHMRFCENISFEPEGSEPEDNMLVTAKGRTKKMKISRGFERGNTASSRDEARENYKKMLKKRNIEIGE
ncbi:MAG: hypothetical protein UX02_C0002G0262 [Candidatus Moranbacteria bacterium GW2011_GWC1_45_18]|nr:MAG: hypothetical protein UT79_C0001G0199 [Candidatus Moranbacteria bacterium GW2011_GWC2_40_12]KKT33358.1 MAG: hypothetical protein UW19_C0009G0004 [Candidatus Moranbacteria bacterium GW2011_GWF2_44_10]KKT72463.1 MAG: hypothetical protein UW66_C0002G0008 [Candidatus Moranbacteria bacterium GW2011_GWF1_44_4]KKT99943.1 MAG: hypothetical protein UX02_C0002G0262 [Candidatus Moranbacteria bacterium GW2011_GWC1_45_18]OGI36891.1 MAG: hypothetical protein A2407_04280 [Candidatus Moranbacteria bacte